MPEFFRCALLLRWWAAFPARNHQRKCKDFPIKVEVFLHPDYRNKIPDEKLLVACLPVYNDSLLTVLPAFQVTGAEMAIDAWSLPLEQPIIVVRIDEVPERSKTYEKGVKNQNFLLNKQESINRILSNKNNYGIEDYYPYYLNVSMTEIQFKGNDYGGPCVAWPPEYYSKAWFWSNNAWKFEQRIGKGDCNDWDPPLDCDDTDWHEISYPKLWNGAAKGLPCCWKFQLWEEDPLAPDDYVEQFVEGAADWGGSESFLEGDEDNADCYVLYDWHHN